MCNYDQCLFRAKDAIYRAEHPNLDNPQYAFDQLQRAVDQLRQAMEVLIPTAEVVEDEQLLPW